MLNNLDPDQARHLVGPDLGPNSLQRSISAEARHLYMIISKLYQCIIYKPGVVIT